MGNKTKTASTVNPTFEKAFDQNYAAAKAVASKPFQSYTGPLAPDAPQATADAVGAAGRVANFAPGMARAVGVGATPGVTAGKGLGAIGDYMNPFTDKVVNYALADIQRQNDIANVGVSQAATQNGGSSAWNGSRAGVAEAETNRAYGDIAAQTAANLRMGGFNQATGLLQNDYDRALAAQQGNQAITAQQQAQSAALKQQTALANQAAGIEGAKVNLGGAQVLGQLGAQQYGMADDEATRAYNEFLRKQNAPYMNQQVLNSALGLYSAGSGSQQTYQKQGALGGILQGVGAVGQGIGAMGQAGMFAAI